MNRRVALTLLAAFGLLAGCAAPRWETATYERFALNRGRAEKGNDLIKVVAVVPGGGALAEAVGVELAKRGFVVIASTGTVGMAADVDFKAVSEHHIPARRNPGEMWKLRHALQARGVHAFLIVRTHDFAPRPYLGRIFWQQAELEIHSTTEENPAFNGAIAGTGFANLRDDRASTPSEAAADMVNRIAMGPGGI